MSFWAGNRQPDLATLADPLSRSQRSLIRADTGRGVTQDLELVKSSQVTFIYIAPLTIQIVTKHCTISKYSIYK